MSDPKMTKGKRPRKNSKKELSKSQSEGLSLAEKVKIKEFKLAVESQGEDEDAKVEKLISEFRNILESLNEKQEPKLETLLQIMENSNSPRTVTLSNTRAILENTGLILKYTKNYYDDLKEDNVKMKKEIAELKQFVKVLH